MSVAPKGYCTLQSPPGGGGLLKTQMLRRYPVSIKPECVGWKAGVHSSKDCSCGSSVRKPLPEVVFEIVRVGLRQNL